MHSIVAAGGAAPARCWRSEPSVRDQVLRALDLSRSGSAGTARRLPPAHRPARGRARTATRSPAAIRPGPGPGEQRRQREAQFVDLIPRRPTARTPSARPRTARGSARAAPARAAHDPRRWPIAGHDHLRDVPDGVDVRAGGGDEQRWRRVPCGEEREVGREPASGALKGRPAEGRPAGRARGAVPARRRRGAGAGNPPSPRFPHRRGRRRQGRATPRRPGCPPGVCRPFDLPFAVTAPSTLATKLTRTPPRATQSRA